MISIQFKLKNFSILENINSFFEIVGKNSDLDLHLDKNLVLRPCINICPLCSSKVHKNGSNSIKSKLTEEIGIKIKLGRIKCSNENCTFNQNISASLFKYWFDYFKSWIDSIALSLATNEMDSPKIARHIKDVYQIPISSEYIRKRVKKLLGEIQKPEPQHEPSEVVVHDEQWVKIKGEDLKRITAIDANNPNIYHDKLYPNRNEITQNKVVANVKSKIKNLKAVVLDGLEASRKAYRNHFKEILIQNCLHHFADNIKNAYRQEVGYGKYKSTLPIEHLIGFFCIINIFFIQDRELFRLRQLQKELNEHIQRINKTALTPTLRQRYISDYKKQYDRKAIYYLYEVHKAKRRKKGIKPQLRTEDEAKLLLQKAKDQNVFPDLVQKQINRLEENWDNFTHCMRDPSIPPTTNKVEQWYALTLNWIDKNNLQSKQQFYQKQKISTMKRYNIPFFKPGAFVNFLQHTVVLLYVFGFT